MNAGITHSIRKPTVTSASYAHRSLPPKVTNTPSFHPSNRSDHAFVLAQNLSSDRDAVARHHPLLQRGHDCRRNIAACRLPHGADDIVHPHRAEQDRGVQSTMGRRCRAVPRRVSANHLGAARPGQYPRDQRKDLQGHRQVDLQGLITAAGEQC